jgi:hypothetical protein
VPVWFVLYRREFHSDVLDVMVYTPTEAPLPEKQRGGLMSIPFWCVFISALLIYVARMPVTKAMKEQGGYNNHLPRQQQAQLTGLARPRWRRTRTVSKRSYCLPWVC